MVMVVDNLNLNTKVWMTPWWRYNRQPAVAQHNYLTIQRQSPLSGTLMYYISSILNVLYSTLAHFFPCNIPNWHRPDV